jgi:hypothetical protein
MSSIKNLIIILSQLILSSCTGLNYLNDGTFYYTKYPKTTLELKPDGHFEYIDLDFVEFNDFVNCKPMQTSGLWERDSLQNIYLSSFGDSLIKSSTIFKKEVNHLDFSVFTFFDLHGDTIFVNYQLDDNGSMITGCGLYRFPNWETSLGSNDTLRLSCSSYPLWTYINQDTTNCNYDVLLYPEYIPNYFNNYKLEVKRGRLINIRKEKVLRKQ